MLLFQMELFGNMMQLCVKLYMFNRVPPRNEIAVH